MPNLQLLYMAIDGVPLYAKMIEQKKRRTIGYILDEVKLKVLELYKSELDIDPNINNTNNDIYYNHYEFELKLRRLRFNKNKISPATKFMSDLEFYIDNYLKQNLDQKIKIILDPYSNMGEGEKKIVYKIHELSRIKQLLHTDLITVYSPDADVILLMLMELDNAQIQIMRYDQQQNQLDMININELEKIILEYMQYQNKSKEFKQKIISDIVMLFTLLGNDFLPKIEKINTNKHIKNIFNSYIKLNIIDTPIFSSNINWIKLKEFFINLNLSINGDHNEFFRKSKNWILLPDQILNHNAIPYYTHIFNIDNLCNTYEPKSVSSIKKEYSNKIINRLTRKYLQGFIWLERYYLEHNFDYKLFYYKFDIAPTINQLISAITQIINNNLILDKILLNLEKTIPIRYFTPETQLIYISASDITDIIDKKYLTSKLQIIINSYDEKFNSSLELNIDNNRINIFDYLDCTNAIFLSKCHIKQMNKMSPNRILDYFYKK
jgi:5'-3' exonuclease